MTSTASPVAADDLIAIGEVCPCCGAQTSRRPVGIVQQSPTVRLLACSRCDAVSVDHVPSEPYLRGLYDPAHYTSSLVSSDRLSRRCAAHVLNQVSFDRDADFTVLDFGGNDGALSRAVIDRLRALGCSGKVTATVVDLFPRENVGDIRFITPQDFARETRQYDLVLASAVLEHLQRPCEVLQQLLSVVRKAGSFYARTPYDLPLSKLSASLGMKWPRHFHDMGPAYWAKVPDLLGMQCTVVRSAPSIVETDWSQSILRTAAAHVLKLPCRFETAVAMPMLGYRMPLWRLVGGWEVVLRIEDATNA